MRRVYILIIFLLSLAGCNKEDTVTLKPMYLIKYVASSNVNRLIIGYNNDNGEYVKEVVMGNNFTIQAKRDFSNEFGVNAYLTIATVDQKDTDTVIGEIYVNGVLANRTTGAKWIALSDKP